MTTRPKNEFSVMQTFVAALPAIDDEALTALIGWLDARGTAELKARRDRASQPAAPSDAPKAAE